MQPVFQHIVTVFQHIATVFQHIATETVSAYIYIFFFVLCFQKTFRNFILQIYDKERKWDSDTVSAAVTATVSAAVTAAVSASHVYS
jgi:hypothetical protein